MGIFLNEYLYYFACVLAILVSVSAAGLFFLTYAREKSLKTYWRLYGFSLMAVAYVFATLARKFPVFEMAFYALQLCAFVLIFLGVRAEPKLSQLNEEGADRGNKGAMVVVRELAPRAIIALVVAIPIIVALTYANTQFPVAGVLVGGGLSLVVVILTLRIQVSRFFGETGEVRTRWQNLYPLLGYVFLFFMSLAAMLSRFPGDTDIVFLRVQALDYSLSWVLVQVLSLIGFGFLAIWAWNFIKIRFTLRTLVILLAISTLISSLGALIFTTLIFRTVENNNFSLLSQAASSQEIVIEDRSRTALSLAKTIATDKSVVDAYSHNDMAKLDALADSYSQISQIDVMRFYNRYGQVTASPTDTREVGTLFDRDSLLAFVLNGNQSIRSIGDTTGVLAPVLVARGIYPLQVDGKLVGAVEVGFKFDNAFVDFAKQRTGLDFTIYADDVRSATTILTSDGVSRWIGSKETEKAVVDQTLKQGQLTTISAERLGRNYYNSFEPIKDINGYVVGMISVGNPTAQLFEDTRQQLLTSFLILTLLSFAAGAGGFLVMRNAVNAQNKQKTQN